MSSRFVPPATNEEPIERDGDWHEAHQTVEANLRRKQEEGKQDGGKSLYEVLQQNKAAKQEAFEESTRLKNQFRTLDEDEVEFLDSVLESTRAKEAAVKKETAEQVEIFRQQREAAEKALLDDADDQQNSNLGVMSAIEQETWTTSGKKRRRTKDKDPLLGTKLRKMSSLGEKDGTPKPDAETLGKKQPGPSYIQKEPSEPSKGKSPVLSPEHKSPPTSASPKTVPPSAPALGLGGYSSDED